MVGAGDAEKAVNIAGTHQACEAGTRRNAVLRRPKADRYGSWAPRIRREKRSGSDAATGEVNGVIGDSENEQYRAVQRVGTV